MGVGLSRRASVVGPPSRRLSPDPALSMGSRDRGSGREGPNPPSPRVSPVDVSEDG